jgi:hypothetical protein
MTLAVADYDHVRDLASGAVPSTARCARRATEAFYGVSTIFVGFKIRVPTTTHQATDWTWRGVAGVNESCRWSSDEHGRGARDPELLVRSGGRQIWRPRAKATSRRDFALK